MCKQEGLTLEAKVEKLASIVDKVVEDNRNNFELLMGQLGEHMVK